MLRWTSIALGLVGFVCFSIWFAWTHLLPAEVADDLRSKSEWSALQVVEQKYRDVPAREPYILLRDAFPKEEMRISVLGINTGSSNGYVWVLLNPHAKPYYKQLPPDQPIHLESADLMNVQRLTEIHPEVLTQLESFAPKERDVSRRVN